MEIEFDEAKDRANQAKHGISLAAAADMDLAGAVVLTDARRPYGEHRRVAYAPLRGRLYAVCYTFRGDVLRVISLRKANERERRRHAKA